MKYFKILIALLLLVGVAACSLNGNETDTAQSEATLVPTPEAGMATVVGKVYSTTADAPLDNVDVRLAEVVRVEDPEVGSDIYVLDQAFSPGAITDENGVFVVENIEAKEYVIIVGDVERAYEVFNDDSGKPKVWNALPDQILDVGVLEVKLSKADF